MQAAIARAMYLTTCATLTDALRQQGTTERVIVDRVIATWHLAPDSWRSMPSFHAASTDPGHSVCAQSPGNRLALSNR